jgi:hypothetical protein
MKNPSKYLLLLVLAACSDDPAAIGSSPDAAPAVIDAPPMVDAGVPDAAPDARPLTGDILMDLAAVPGMTVREGTSEVSGYRYFIATYDQPANHLRPADLRFQQRVRILHRSYDAPTVLITEGYFVQTSARRVELSALANANQISVEHRYFMPSRPQPTDWGRLEIWQAATDHHRVVQGLKHIYPGRWLNTGASKSGMAAVYHRRFYPDDVYGTFAYVAPLSFGPNDPRYVNFVETAGPEGDCRTKLHTFQRLVLSEPLRSQMVMAMGSSFMRLGTEKALEHTVLELPFGLWQYAGPSACQEIPQQGASAGAFWAFLESVGRINDFDDEDVVAYGPYYYQAATQLGYPKINETHVADLLKFPGTDTPDAYLPDGAVATFDTAAMRDVDRWVKTEGERLLFIYGEWDPWSAAAFSLGDGSSDSFVLWVPGGNHGSKISQLPAAGNAVALDAVKRWADLPDAPAAKPAADEELAPMIRGRPRL